jgi:hypothetical protein
MSLALCLKKNRLLSFFEDARKILPNDLSPLCVEGLGANENGELLCLK